MQKGNAVYLQGFVNYFEVKTVGNGRLMTFSLSIPDARATEESKRRAFVRVERWIEGGFQVPEDLADTAIVQVKGAIAQDQFQDKAGNNRRVLKVHADEVKVVRQATTSSASSNDEVNLDVPF